LIMCPPSSLNILPSGHGCLKYEEKAISPGGPPAEFNKHAVRIAGS
jgi:hypothetical protein